MFIIGFPPAAARAVYQRGNVEGNQFLPQRIPIWIAESRRSPKTFARIGIHQKPDKAHVLHAAIDLIEGNFNWLPANLRQGSHAAESGRMLLNVAMDDVVLELNPEIYIFEAPMRMHECEGSG